MTRRAVPVVPVVLLLLASLVATALTTPPASAASPRVEMRVLVVTDGQPEVEAVRDALTAGGVPIDVVDLADPVRPHLDAAALTLPDDVPHSRYQGVVLPNESPEALTPAELAAVHDLEREFGLRQINALITALPATGLAEPSDTTGWSGQVDGITTQLTPAAKADGFGDMRGPVPVDGDTWAEIGTPLPGYTPLLTATSPDGGRSGAVAGVLAVDGREELGLALTFEAGSTQFTALAPGLIEWLTRGTHLGVRRDWFAVHVDDVLLPDARWVVGAHCAYGADCPPGIAAVPTIRMTAADVEYAAAWSAQHGLRLDLAFNGAGSAAAVPNGEDPLLAALVAHKTAFGFLNHTWSHLYLGCVRDYSVTPWRCATVPILGWTRYVPGSEIEDQIARNLEFARVHGLPLDPEELVTGEHSGLRGDEEMAEDNPWLAGALDAEGVRTIASDASKEPAQRRIGAALTVPRHPIDLDYDTATFAETVDQYAWSHTSRADGGDGTCEADGGCVPALERSDPAAAFAQVIVLAEAAKALGHVLGNDPRPHYVHQPQLTEDRTLYPVLEKVLDGHGALYTEARPVLVPTMTQSRDELRRQADWAAAAPTVRAWVQDGAVTVVGDGLVPLTMPAGSSFGEAYGTTRSAWVQVSGERRV
ncbi:hypothetical protein GCM10023215_06440 [Pseudonocardia yuanmonensis]|uniref:NodB homology domain-containing protein n=1 Tax=Pseudonocardia yuanmonensis TaxID=1095914 RepID=A0ABP8W224_9PSEU